VKLMNAHIVMKNSIGPIKTSLRESTAARLLALTENQMLFSTLLNLGIVRKISNFPYSLGV
jgi:hypothetical protein